MLESSASPIICHTRREIICAGTREVSDSAVKSLITNKITLLPIAHDFKGIDALIFTSQYAFKALLESSIAPSVWRTLPCFVIGESSANILREHGAKIAFIGSGNGSEFANTIAPMLKDKVPLYLRAKEIVSQLDEILMASNIALQECIAYANTPLALDSSLKPKAHSIIIFSAPSAYKSFVNSFGWDDSYIAIAIGEATFESFDKTIQAHKAKNPSIKACIALAKDISQAH